MNKKPLVILTGPTAVGKTSLSINLAKEINGAIISADSMQIYKYMDIGTAKIMSDEMGGVDHYLIDEFEPDNEFNIVRFQEYGKKYMNQIYKQGKIPIIVGGTGFYIQSILYDIDFDKNPEDDSYRMELEEVAEKEGGELLHNRLKEIDPKSANLIHPNNIRRVIRALEYFKQTGEKISSHNAKEREKISPYNYGYYVLNRDREVIYNRINERVDKMIQDGLVEEVKSLLERGYSKDLVSMQGLGYKEIVMYLEGKLTLEEAIYTLKRDTRHFAKRQITWFKRERDVCWVQRDDKTQNDEIIRRIKEDLIAKNII